MERSIALITGGGGFIGRRLCRALTERGRRVWAQILPGEPEPPCERCIEADVRSMADVERLCEGPIESIYHLAAHANVPESVEDPRADFEVNVAGTFNLLEMARRLELGSFVFPSTLSVLAPSNALPLAETAGVGPRAPYPAAKLAGEAYCLAYAGSYGVPARVVRLPNVYGPGITRLVVYELIRKALRRPAELAILGDGSQVRDFLYIDDAVEGLIAVGDRGANGEVYHVGSGEPTTIRRLAELIIGQADLADIPVVSAGETWKGDIPRWYADISKIRGLGFSPAVDLRDGIARTMEWIRKTGTDGCQQQS